MKLAIESLSYLSVLTSGNENQLDNYVSLLVHEVMANFQGINLSYYFFLIH